MIRPLAYVTADFSSRDEEADEAAAKYCRVLYEAGYAPVCPFFAQTWFLCTDIPQEYADARNMAHEFLRRSRVLVICGKNKTKSMMEDIAVAKRYGVVTVTLEGILNADKKRTSNYSTTP